MFDSDVSILSDLLPIAVALFRAHYRTSDQAWIGLMGSSRRALRRFLNLSAYIREKRLEGEVVIDLEPLVA